MSQSSMTRILDQAIDAVVQIDGRNCVTYMNAAAEALWLVDRRDVLGRNVKMLVPREMQADHDSWVNRNRRTGKDRIVGSSRDVTLERSDGSVVIANLSLSKVEEDDGTVSYTAFVKDVTEQRQAQESITQTLEQALDAVVTIDTDNRVTFFNSAAEELWGYSRDEVLGQNVKMLVPAEMQPRHDGFVNNNRRTGQDKIVGTSREVPVHRKNGDVRWGNLSLSRVELSNGDKIYTAFVRDVTEEVERRRQIEILSMVANETAAAVLVADDRGRIIFANQGFETQSGVDAKAVAGERIDGVLRGENTDPHVSAALAAAIVGGEAFEREMLLYRRDQTPFWVNFAMNPVRGKDGKVENFVALLTNIDQVKVEALDNRARLSALAETNAIAEWSAAGQLLSVNTFLDGRCRMTAAGTFEQAAYELTEILGAAEKAELYSQLRLTRQVIWPAPDNEQVELVLDATFVAVSDAQGDVRKIIMCGADATSRRAALSEVERAVEKLRASGDKIGKCGSLINEISTQTDMLSLNASIEAAHAGARGKGFAVVANAVKALAERSADSAAQISDIVEENRETIAEATRTLHNLST
jgi:PAS domain S-box-containing protein